MPSTDVRTTKPSGGASASRASATGDEPSTTSSGDGSGGTSASGVDHPGVEAEPVHAPHMARVLDLHATVHDHVQAALLGDSCRFTTDDPELHPECLRPDFDSLLGNRRHELRCAEHVDDVDGKRNVGQAREGLFAQYFRFVGVDRHYTVAMALHVEADEVAWP